MSKAPLLIAAIVIAFLMWSGYWFIGASARSSSLETWFEDRRDASWVADAGDVDLRGYPNRFDTIISDIEISDPATGWAWSAPEFQLLSLSYQPDHIIALWPQEQTVSTPYEKIRIASKEMRASLIFEDRDALTPERFTATMEAVSLNSSAGWDAKFDDAVLAIRPSAGENQYDLAFRANGFQPGRKLLAKLELNNKPVEFDQFDLQTVAGFSAALNRENFEAANSRLETLEITQADIKWGDLELKARGSLTADAKGYAQGRLTIRAVNWKEMLELAGELDLILPDMVQTLMSGLTLVARLAGNERELDIPLNFAGGDAKLGIIPIGKAPKMRWP